MDVVERVMARAAVGMMEVLAVKRTRGRGLRCIVVRGWFCGW